MPTLVQNFMASKIVQQAQERHLLTIVVRQHIPVNCRTHCWVGHYRTGKLTLLTDDAIFFTALRLQEEALKENLSKTPHFRDIQSIKFRVHPGCAAPIDQAPQRKASLPSDATRSLFTHTAQTIQHPELRKQLENFGKAEDT